MLRAKIDLNTVLMSKIYALTEKLNFMKFAIALILVKKRSKHKIFWEFLKI